MIYEIITCPACDRSGRLRIIKMTKIESKSQVRHVPQCKSCPRLSRFILLRFKNICGHAMPDALGAVKDCQSWWGMGSAIK